MSRRSYSGNAVATTLAAGISNSDMTITIANATGYPTGSSAPFVIVLNRGQAGEEKVLIGSRSGTTLTVATSGRGYDGTSAASHSSGATVEHCLAAVDVDESNAHVNDTARDDHTQYHNTARHAAVSHLIGTHLPAPAAAADVGTAAAAGASTSAARADHVHKLGSGIAGSGLELSSGALRIAAAAAGNGLTGGAGSALAVNVDGSTLEINTDTVRIKDAGVTAAKLASGVHGDGAKVDTAQTTASTSFTDLATSGPAVTVTVPASGKVLVLLSMHASNSEASEQINLMGVALSGANTVSASDDDSCVVTAATATRGGSAAIPMTGLSAGSTTFTAKYRTGAGTGTFRRRKITVIPLP